MMTLVIYTSSILPKWTIVPSGEQCHRCAGSGTLKEQNIVSLAVEFKHVEC